MVSLAISALGWPSGTSYNPASAVAICRTNCIYDATVAFSMCTRIQCNIHIALAAPVFAYIALSAPLMTMPTMVMPTCINAYRK